ncbi:uncharacterized protein LOC105423271 [Pogonomyrmex barbatus]|uniref:Uncharacterized protein LOC105423271 n=1 Tax=Pogonomyrmex barbatus TaxID=144034 RepID=A0A6I9VTL7_9HYME|nr:uncharacterized protein LOC105423271 [Pogonomyrmex barbatus]
MKYDTRIPREEPCDPWSALPILIEIWAIDLRFLLDLPTSPKSESAIGTLYFYKALGWATEIHKSALGLEFRQEDIPCSLKSENTFAAEDYQTDEQTVLENRGNESGTLEEILETELRVAFAEPPQVEREMDSKEREDSSLTKEFFRELHSVMTDLRALARFLPISVAFSMIGDLIGDLYGSLWTFSATTHTQKNS